MRGGLKTAAGKNRVIPINHKIESFIITRMQQGNKYLFTNEGGNGVSYYTYYDCIFKPIMEQLQIMHKPHDCRHTFATLMSNAGANKVSIQRIMGHASKDITDKVYTHKDIEELIKAIDLI
jgi:integrase